MPNVIWHDYRNSHAQMTAKLLKNESFQAPATIARKRDVLMYAPVRRMKFRSLKLNSKQRFVDLMFSSLVVYLERNPMKM